MEIAVGPICRLVAVPEVALVALAAAPAAARMTGILRPPTVREMVRRVPLEVAYSSALRGAGGMTKDFPRAWI